MYRAVRQLHSHHQFPTASTTLPPIRQTPTATTTPAFPAKNNKKEEVAQRMAAAAAAVAAKEKRKSTTTAKAVNNGNGGGEQQRRQQQIQLCQERELAAQNDGMLEVKLEGGRGARVLVIKKADGDFVAIQPDCPNCECPLAKGVLTKSHIRCATHGSAYNLRTGLLEDGVGLNSIWTFKVQLIGPSLFGDISLQKLASLRFGPEPLSRPPSGQIAPIVVVGGGIAGLTCVETLRQLGFTGPILLISREKELPYDRKSLSKKLCSPSAKEGEDDDSRALRSRQFLEHHLNIGLWLGHSVKSIHPKEHRINVEEKNENGELAKAVEYSQLVLALGATNRRLQGVKEADQLEGVLYLRTLDDGRQLAKEVRHKNVAIIGSGFLGFEIASAVAPVARNVSIFGKASAPLTLLGTGVGNEIRKFMEEQGVSVRQESIIRSMAGFDRVQQLTFRDGLTAIADTVIVAIGVMPSTSILMGSGIRTNTEGYVLVDERMQTNVPNIFACGDCVNFPISTAAGQQLTMTTTTAATPRRANIPHWQIAQYQGRQAAHSILGISAQPRFVPFLWIRLFNRLLHFSGDPTVEADERIQRGSILGNDFVAYLLKADRVVGVASCGPKNVAIQFIELFRKGKAVSRAEVQRNAKDEWKHLLMAAE